MMMKVHSGELLKKPLTALISIIKAAKPPATENCKKDNDVLSSVQCLLMWKI